jgi:hypothetical protein
MAAGQPRVSRETSGTITHLRLNEAAQRAPSGSVSPSGYGRRQVGLAPMRAAGRAELKHTVRAPGLPDRRSRVRCGRDPIRAGCGSPNACDTGLSSCHPIAFSDMPGRLWVNELIHSLTRIDGHHYPSTDVFLWAVAGGPVSATSRPRVRGSSRAETCLRRAGESRTRGLRLRATGTGERPTVCVSDRGGFHGVGIRPSK